MSTAITFNQPAGNTARGCSLKAYNKIQLCQMYDVSRHTFARWLAPFTDALGPYSGRVYTPRQVQIIFEQLGMPDRDERGNLIIR